MTTTLTNSKDPIPCPKITAQDVWLAAAKALLVREKEVARVRDELNAERAPTSDAMAGDS